MLLRIAMLLALTDSTLQIEVHHLEAAMAWVRYWEESVAFIFATAQDEAKAEQTTTAAARIMDYLHQHEEVTRTQLANDCFKKRISKDVLDTAIHELLTATPPRLVLEQRQREGGKGSGTKFYKIPPANSAKSAKPVEGVSGNDIPDGVRNLRNVRNLKNPDRTQVPISPAKAPDFADFAEFANPEKQAQHLEPQHISQTSHISQGISEKHTSGDEEHL
jgi:hypothetical protein